MKCALCTSKIKDTERHATIVMPVAKGVIDPKVEAEYKEMQLNYPMLAEYNAHTWLPLDKKIPICLGCAVGLLGASALGWHEFESLKKESS